MKTIEQMLRNLGRPDVAEVALISDRLPCARVGSEFDPIDNEAPSADTILEMLVTVGGSRYVDSLGPDPRHWTARIDGIGVIGVVASMPKEGEVQARFALMKRDERGRAPEVRKKSVRPTRPEVRRATRGGLKAARPPSRDRMPAVNRNAPTLEALVLDRDSLPPATSQPSAKQASFRQVPTAPAVHVSRAQPPAASPARPGPGSRFPTEPGTGPSARKRPPSSSRGPETRSELEVLLKAARDAGASDLHVVAGRPMLLRVAGELRPKGEVLDAETVEMMLLPCVPTRLSEELGTDGSCDFALDHRALGRFRVNVSRQQTGYKASIRLIAREVPTLERLGLPISILSATKHHQGLIVVTGPTGHGKTSTLAAIVNVLNGERTSHIVTVEDPVEYVHPRRKAIMSQREVGTHTKSFATALKAALREDPDVIVVGELRDTETVRMAVAAAETGHLVLGTMNTPSAAKTIDRLIDLFPPADQPQVRVSLAAGLRLIVSQRLVPSVDKTRLFAAAELLPGSVALSALIRENKTFQIPSLQQRGKALGIVRLDDSLAELVHGCYVAAEGARVFAESPQEFEALLSMHRGGAAGLRGGDDAARAMLGRKV